MLGVEELYNPFIETNVYYMHNYTTIKTLFKVQESYFKYF